MAVQALDISDRVAQTLQNTYLFSAQERLVLAKLLLDSLLHDEAQSDLDWMALGLASFEEDWDNPEDAIYDDWREIYGISEG